MAPFRWSGSHLVRVRHCATGSAVRYIAQLGIQWIQRTSEDSAHLRTEARRLRAKPSEIRNVLPIFAAARGAAVSATSNWRVQHRAVLRATDKLKWWLQHGCCNEMQGAFCNVMQHGGCNKMQCSCCIMRCNVVIARNATWLLQRY